MAQLREGGCDVETGAAFGADAAGEAPLEGSVPNLPGVRQAGRNTRQVRRCEAEAGRTRQPKLPPGRTGQDEDGWVD